jgi:hypothetical protein
MITRARLIAAASLTIAVFLISAPVASATNTDSGTGRAGGSDSHTIAWIAVSAVVLAVVAILFFTLRRRRSGTPSPEPKSARRAPLGEARSHPGSSDAADVVRRPGDVDDAGSRDRAGAQRVLVR